MPVGSHISSNLVHVHLISFFVIVVANLALRQHSSVDQGKEKSEVEREGYVRMASPPRPLQGLRGQTHRIPKRPFSNAYTVQQRRSTVREGYTKERHRAHVRAKGEDDGYAEDRQASSASASHSSGFSGLVSNLLFGAATSLERGDATCAQCRGTGVCKCSACKGAGIMKQKVRMNVLRHAVNRVKVLVGMEGGSMYDTQWQMSNRCRRCKGQGQMICSTCGGLGSRGPSKGARRQLISK